MLHQGIGDIDAAIMALDPDTMAPMITFESYRATALNSAEHNENIMQNYR